MTSSSTSNLRLLIWLKWKLQWRACSRDSFTLAGTVASLVLFTPPALGVAVGSYFGFRLLPPEMSKHLLAGVLLAIYLVWLALPTLGRSISESYDITKLLLYPVSVRRIFTGVVVGSLTDVPVVLAMPAVLVIAVSFTGGVFGFPLVLATLGLFLFHALALSQVILVVGAGMLRSRRFRDLVIVGVPLLLLAGFVGYQYCMAHAFELAGHARELDWSGIMLHPAWAMVDFTPPGVAARAIAAASQGHYLWAAGFAAILGAVCAATLWLAEWLVGLVATGHVVSFRRRRRAAEPAAVGRAPAREAGAIVRAPAAPGAGVRARAARGLRLPPVMAAMVGKEIKYLLREAYFKSMLLGTMMMVLFGIIVFLRPWEPPEDYWVGPGPMLWVVTGYAIAGEAPLLFNLFGSEGGAAAVLFLFPGSRRQILLGKSVVLLGALLIVNFAVVVLLCALTGLYEMFGPLLAWTAMGTVVLAAVGNLVSVLAPVGLVRRGWRLQPTSPGRGCGYSLLCLAFLGLAAGLGLPVFAAALVPTYWAGPIWFAVSLPLAAAYAGGLYLLSLHLAEPLLREREFEVVGRLTREEK